MNSSDYDSIVIMTHFHDISLSISSLLGKQINLTVHSLMVVKCVMTDYMLHLVTDNHVGFTAFASWYGNQCWLSTFQYSIGHWKALIWPSRSQIWRCLIGVLAQFINRFFCGLSAECRVIEQTECLAETSTFILPAADEDTSELRSMCIQFILTWDVL